MLTGRAFDRVTARLATEYRNFSLRHGGFKIRIQRAMFSKLSPRQRAETMKRVDVKLGQHGKGQGASFTFRLERPGIFRRGIAVAVVSFCLLFVACLLLLLLWGRETNRTRTAVMDVAGFMDPTELAQAKRQAGDGRGLMSSTSVDAGERVSHDLSVAAISRLPSLQGSLCLSTKIVREDR